MSVYGPVDPGAARRTRLRESTLYVVTGAREERGDLEAFLEAILSARVDIVQLREKEAEAGDLIRWGRVFKESAAAHGALFVVNDRPDVAMALDADGVHLGQGDLPVYFARRLVGPGMLIGLSTHDAEQLEGASPELDYLSVGPVHETPTKEGRPATGLGLVSVASQQAKQPWFAIGGIDAGNLPEVVDAGARRIVVVRAVTEADDPASAVRRLLEGLPNPHRR